MPTADEARNELFAIRQAFLEARKTGQTLPLETVQALLDRAQQLIASLGLQAPSQPTPSQPTTTPRDDEARRRGAVAVGTVQDDVERIYAPRQSSQAQQGVAVYQTEIRKAITADEAVQMALERQLVGREIRLAHLDLVYEQQRLDATNESLRLITTFLQGIRGRVSAGTMELNDLMQAQLEESRMRMELVRAQNRRSVSELKLRTLTVGDVSDPLWNTRLTAADGATFRPSTEEIGVAAAADVQEQTWEETLKNAALQLQERMDTRRSSETQLAAQQELFAAGKTTNAQLVQAQRNLNEARQMELSAILVYRRAEVQLNRLQAISR